MSAIGLPPAAFRERPPAPANSVELVYPAMRNGRVGMQKAREERAVCARSRVAQSPRAQRHVFTAGTLARNHRGRLRTWRRSCRKSGGLSRRGING